MAEHPWPIDPTPGAMVYVGVCGHCHGVTFICPVDQIATHMQTLIDNALRGNHLYREQVKAYHKCEDRCQCHKEEVPHAH